MTRPLPFFTLDVFTDTPYRGNPLAVVLEADRLNTVQMQSMAQEFNLSETIFVMAPRDKANTACVRIFFPTAEIPFAGHPTLGCAALLASLRNGDGDGDGDGDFTDHILLEEQAGLVPVNICRRSGLISGRFIAPILPRPHAGEAPVPLLAAALGLPESAIGFGGHRPGVFEGGPAFLYAPIAGLDSLVTACPIEPHWSELMSRANVDSAYLYTANGSNGFRARMFSPTAGIPEDPATGSASAILAAQLKRSGALPEGDSHWQLAQGIEMGRESRIGLSILYTSGALREVRISGSAVQISHGEIIPPAATS